MDILELKKAIVFVGEFVRELKKFGIRSKNDYQKLLKDFPMFIRIMEKYFEYYEKEGMPKITELINFDFHPNHPLVLLNYTEVAHQNLCKWKNGWTTPIRICRGIVYDTEGNLVSLPFVKFFNHGEHEESKNLSLDNLVEAFYKEDGHMVNVFVWNNELIATTRGCFTSIASKLATEMGKAGLSARNIVLGVIKDLMIVAELIHPRTKIVVDYENEEKLIILNARMKWPSLEILSYDKLCELSEFTGFSVKEKADVKTLEEAIKKAKNLTGREGLVVKVGDGDFLLKLKSPWYLSRFRHRYSYASLMIKIADNKKEFFKKIPPEIKDDVEKMIDTIKEKAMIACKKSSVEELYLILPEKSRTEYFKSACRKLFKKCIYSKNLDEILSLE